MSKTNASKIRKIVHEDSFGAIGFVIGLILGIAIGGVR